MTDSKFHTQPAKRQASSPAPAKPFVFVPDQVWDGNDGAWTSWVIQVGTPPQYFRVLPSVNGQETWVPLPIDCQRGPSWCGNARGVEPFKNPSTAVALSTLDAGSTCSLNRSPLCENCVSIEGHCTTGPCAGQYCCGGDPGACSSAGCNGVSGICTAAYIGCVCTGDDYDILTNKLHSPGAANPATAAGFQFNQSSTWSMIGNHTLSGNNQLPDDATGLYGTDIVAAGPNPGAALIPNVRSTVAGIAAQPYYLGLLGLRPSKSSRFDGSSPSFLTILKAQNLIPSLSFGYTAGAAYSEHTPGAVVVESVTDCIAGSQGVLGSLVLGGYDRSKFMKNTANFELDQDKSLALISQLQSITASDTLIGDVQLMADNITATIDSDLPYLYLPNSACKNFEKAFGLRWDASKELYLVNDSNHAALRTSNPTIVFSFGQSRAEVVNITLPYQAFDLQVTRPIADNGTNYFPLRCSADPSSYILGRAFLQETYLLVDYETSNFALSQALFSNQSDIVAINHAEVKQSSEPDAKSSQPSSLSHGAIAGIAIGASVAIVLLLSLFFCQLRRAIRGRRAGRRRRGSISGPIPCGGSKEAWAVSPTSSGDHYPDPTTTANVDGLPFQRFEERLERLERANHAASTAEVPGRTITELSEDTTIELPEDTTTELPEDSRLQRRTSRGNTSSQWPLCPTGHTYENFQQELAGSPTARELQDQLKPANHVFELGTGNSRRTSGKR
ncbi:MAG: hypothetical protein Q9168_003115 [Polycauliona sp. 1 TL-2023]